jgi:hypothetical protein
LGVGTEVDEMTSGREHHAGILGAKRPFGMSLVGRDERHSYQGRISARSMTHSGVDSGWVEI